MNRMPLAVTLCAFAAACGDDGGPRFPVNPGGSGTGMGSSMTMPDAPMADAGDTISGRVCLISDARAPVTCLSSGAGNLTVTLGGETASTADNGNFTITTPTDGGTLVWSVTGSGIVSSAMAFSTSTTIPAISTLLYDDMVVANNAVIITGNGAIIARVTNGNATVSNVVATPSPQSDSVVYYDSNDALSWDEDATGTAGVVWIPSITTGPASLALDNGSSQKTVSNINVVADTITFVFTTFP